MTVIVGYVAEDRVWMAADSNTAEASTSQIWKRDQPKIWRHPKGVLLGFAGSTALEMACRIDEALWAELATAAPNDHWAFRIAHRISDLAERHKLMAKDGNEMEGEALLAWGDKLWEITYRCALPIPTMAALGAGRGPAWGALCAVHRLGWHTPAERTSMAVSVAIELNDSCRVPISLEVTDALPT